MNVRTSNSNYRLSCSSLRSELVYSTDQLLDFVYQTIELPIQRFFRIVSDISLCYHRRRTLVDASRHITQILVYSYAVSILLYIGLLITAHLYSISIQNHYFVDPFLSANRQCIDLKFVHHQHESENLLLEKNFIQQHSFIGDSSELIKSNNYTQFHQFLSLLSDQSYIICQRSLYIYSRFGVYTSLLHSNNSHFRFILPNNPSPFTIDRPPFIDLCLHVSNRSHLEEIKSRLVPFSFRYYASINLFLFDFNFTQVSLTFYMLDSESKHLERVSIHTGWLYDLYSRFYFFKYNHALSTVLFDGISSEQQIIDYFGYLSIPVPSDPILGLNEMVQEILLILPLC